MWVAWMRRTVPVRRMISVIGALSLLRVTQVTVIRVGWGIRWSRSHEQAFQTRCFIRRRGALRIAPARARELQSEVCHVRPLRRRGLAHDAQGAAEGPPPNAWGARRATTLAAESQVCLTVRSNQRRFTERPPSRHLRWRTLRPLCQSFSFNRKRCRCRFWPQVDLFKLY